MLSFTPPAPLRAHLSQLSSSPITTLPLCSHKHLPPLCMPSASSQIVSKRRRVKSPASKPKPSASRKSTTLTESQPLCSPPLFMTPDETNLYQSLIELTFSRGALGRGVRATLRAFHRRASFLPLNSEHIYVEFGPAYVLATARIYSSEPVTRFAVEQRAWPRLQQVLAWDEVNARDARSRGVSLRHLHEGGRYGRHLFIPRHALQLVLHIASHLVGEAEPSGMLEAVVNLRRRPLPGVRTVAVRCPRSLAHSNGDRKPSLVLWMNSDGVTGGAMCPVCMSGGRQVTWRVHYITANTAALYTPRGRLSSNARATKHIPQHERHSNSPQDVQHQKPPQPGMYPVGGCVLSPQKAKNIGQVITMAYVTASLKIATDTNTTAEVMQDCNRVRTPGTMARHKCPLQVLLWSDRRSKGATMSKRVEDVAWFARQTLGIDDALGDDSTNFEGDVVESEEWLPTPIVSVSAMRPSGWRDVSTAARRSVSVPATWEASAQAWVLFDMDDMCNLEEDGVVLVAAHKIVLAARRNQELSGRCLVMQTGPHGLHVWSELREVRDEPRVWFKKEETREWYSDLGLKLLQASHRAGAKGGKIDMSSCSAGRFARRPGWRLLEDGTLFRSHIVMHVPSVVKGRKPRKGER